MAKEFKQKISLKYKLFLVFIPIILSVVLFVFYASLVNVNINYSFSKIDKSFDNLTDVIDLKTSMENLSSVTFAYAESGGSIWKKKYDDLSVIFSDLLLKISPTEDWDEGVTIIKEFKKTVGDIQKTESASIKKVVAGDKVGALAVLDSQYTDNISLAGNLLYAFIDKGRDNVSSEIVGSQDFLIVQELLFIAVGFLLLLITLFVMARVFNLQIIQPVQKLAKTAKIIADGDMTSRVEITSRDEIGSLAYDFNVMLDRLQFSHNLLNNTIEDLNKANKELKKLDQMKSDFITVVAHQLRTPLTGIKWSLTALINGNVGTVKGEQAEYLKGAIDSNQRMIDTVNQILSMKKIEEGSLEDVRTSVNLANLLHSVLFDVYQQATQKNIKINIKMDRDSLPNLDFTEGDVRIIMQNLLENSLIYSKEKSQVDVSLVKEGDNVVFSVRDYGIGIPEDQKKNLFTKFFRTTNAIKHFANGSGLGLTIVKKTVDRYGGKIWFESQEGKGTTFYVSLPV